MQGEKLEQTEARNVPGLVVKELTAILLDWVEFHAEKRLVSRKVWEQKIVNGNATHEVKGARKERQPAEGRD